MKETAIKFNDEMVRAILDGRKTQTRRPIKPQPVKEGGLWKLYGAGWFKDFGAVLCMPGHSLSTQNPFGQQGDRLLVTPTVEQMKALEKLVYRAEDPKKVQRFATLEIVSVRVERVQDISEADAQAEGMELENLFPPARYGEEPPATELFRDLWSSLYSKGGFDWDANPWVWVIEFRRIDA